jgi:CRISPR-associated protein Csm3
MRKIGYHEITGVIYFPSGFRIGGSDELLQIGGTDLTCIKHPVTLQPYVPGTSLKGKIRSELEQSTGKISAGGRPCNCIRTDCLVCLVFGPHAKPDHNLGPTRIIIRDAQLIPGHGWEAERKASTAINRETGTALKGSFRTEERVAAGSEFALRIGIQVWDKDITIKYKDQAGSHALVEFVKDGLRLVQRTGIGSKISTGSGEVEFRDLKLDGTPFTL